MAIDFNPYKVLKVDPSADDEIIAAAFRVMSKKYHPDVNKSAEAQALMQQINRAYDMLKDPQKRKDVDAELSRANSTSSSSSYSSAGSASRYSSSYSSGRSSYSNSSSGTSSSSTAGTANNTGPFSSWSSRTRGSRTTSDDNFYLYQKRLSDEKQNKVLRISVTYDKLAGGKVCNIFGSARDKNGKLTSGTVYLKSPELFDLINDLEDAIQQLDQPAQPIEMNSDHDVYFRRSIAGMGRTFIGVEVIKLTHDDTKQGLFLIGEKKNNGQIDGVGSYQTQKQLIQCERIFKEALSAMR